MKLLFALFLVVAMNVCTVSSQLTFSAGDELKMSRISAASMKEITRLYEAKTVLKFPDQNAAVQRALKDFMQSDKRLGDNSNCDCHNYTCGCCLHLEVDKISLNDTACVNISYLPDEYGFQFILSLNGKILISEKVSAKNPPPICAAIPYIHKLASLCIRFYNLDFRNRTFSGCVDIEAELEGIVVKKFEIGCFHIPPGQQAPQIANKEEDKPMRSEVQAVSVLPSTEEGHKALHKFFDTILLADGDLKATSSGCRCHVYTCGCCLHFKVATLGLNDTACVDLSYLPDEFGIQVALTLDGHVLFSKKISAKNPPALCAAIPYLHKVASICIRFYNLDFNNRQLSGCSDLEAMLAGMTVAKFKFGCFRIPPGELGVVGPVNMPLV